MLHLVLAAAAIEANGHADAHTQLSDAAEFTATLQHQFEPPEHRQLSETSICGSDETETTCNAYADWVVIIGNRRPAESATIDSVLTTFLSSFALDAAHGPRIAVMYFDGQAPGTTLPGYSSTTGARELLGFSDDASAVQAAFYSRPPALNSLMCTSCGIVGADELLDGRTTRLDAGTFVLLVTDNEQTIAGTDFTAGDAADDLKADGVTVFTVRTGSALDDFMEEHSIA